MFAWGKFSVLLLFNINVWSTCETIRWIWSGVLSASGPTKWVYVYITLPWMSWSHQILDANQSHPWLVLALETTEASDRKLPQLVSCLENSTVALSWLQLWWHFSLPLCLWTMWFRNTVYLLHCTFEEFLLLWRWKKLQLLSLLGMDCSSLCKLNLFSVNT